ncbi:hypothetical protein V6N13_029908 [Hibiscus sabdariffa]
MQRGVLVRRIEHRYELKDLAYRTDTWVQVSVRPWLLELVFLHGILSTVTVAWTSPASLRETTSISIRIAGLDVVDSEGK